LINVPFLARVVNDRCGLSSYEQHIHVAASPE